MAYIRYKEVTKHFNFSRVISREKLPAYTKQYVLDDENILACYETSRDHGIFTDNKIVLFDNVSLLGKYKQIYTIPYKSISVFAITFGNSDAELNLSLDCGFPLNLKFVNMKAEDKIRLRVLYTCINRIINNQKPRKEDIERLLNDDFHLNIK